MCDVNAAPPGDADDHGCRGERCWSGVAVGVVSEFASASGACGSSGSIGGSAGSGDGVAAAQRSCSPGSGIGLALPPEPRPPPGVSRPMPRLTDAPSLASCDRQSAAAKLNGGRMLELAPDVLRCDSGVSVDNSTGMEDVDAWWKCSGPTVDTDIDIEAWWKCGGRMDDEVDSDTDG